MDLRPPRVFFLGLCAWAAYFVARTLVMDLLPANDWASFVEQDLFISVFRLGTLLFCLWLGRLAYDKEVWWGGRPGRAGWAWGLGAVLVLGDLVGLMARPAAPLEGMWGTRAIEVGINILVAFNEEFGWRGVLFLSLKDWLGEKAALWGTALLFTAMHLGYQPLIALPHVLAVGLAFGAARLRGVSLLQLVAIHAAMDVALALYLPMGVDSSWWHGAVATVTAFVAAYWIWTRPARDAVTA